MRIFALLLALSFLAGCASKPPYYISPAPVTIPKTATFWVDTFDVKVVGQGRIFMSDAKVREQLGVDLVDRLLKAKRYASSKQTADYLLDVDIVYVRHILDSKGGITSLVVDDNTILQSIDFGYKVKVKKKPTPRCCILPRIGVAWCPITGAARCSNGRPLVGS